MINLYKIFNVKENPANGSADMYIYGIIGANFEGDTNNIGFQLVSLIKSLESKFQRINIHINSPGGDVGDGMAVYNTIKNSSADIQTFNDGFVGSMAGIIFLAGKTTHAAKASINHIHQPSTITMGNIRDHEQALMVLNKWQDVLVSAISDKTGIDPESVKMKWFDGNEHMLSSVEAKDLGLVDVVDDVPANVDETIKNLSYKEIIALYNKDSQSVVKRLFKSFFPKNQSITNKQSSNMNPKFKLQAYLFFAVMCSSFELVVDDSGNVSVPQDAFKKLLDDYNAAQSKITDLETKVFSASQKDEEINALKQTVFQLEAKLASHPTAPATPQGATDQSASDVKFEDLDSFTQQAILERR